MTNISEPMDPLNMLPLLNTISEENDFQEICTICQDVLDNGEEQIHRLTECQHAFHTNCIITWFRTGQNNCPCCGDKGINNNEKKGRYRWARGTRIWRNNHWELSINKDIKYKMIRDYVKKDDCPSEIKNIIKKYDNVIEEINNLGTYIKTSKIEIEQKPYSEANKELKGLQKQMCNKRKLLNNLINKIIDYPIVSLIIPKKKYK